MCYKCNSSSSSSSCKKHHSHKCKKVKIIPNKCNKCGSLDIVWNKSHKTHLVADPDLDKAMELLNDAFIVVDDGFNTKGGLTVPEISVIGYFGPTSTVLAHGPFPDCHSNPTHSNVAGTFQAFGITECAYLQQVFEGGILSDSLFPYSDNTNYTDAPKLYHTFPAVTSYLGNNQFTVTATAIVHYSGDGIPANQNSPVIARVGSVAQYNYRCDEHGNTLIPEIVWIHFTIAYFDCTLSNSFLKLISS